MKTKSWIANVSGLVIASLVLVAGPAAAGEYAYSRDRHQAVYDYAKVVSVTPVVRYVTVTTPVKECWEDMEHYTRTHANPGRAGKTLFGAILGGVIGHQFGSGRGNDAATVAGTLIGAAVANGSDNRPYYRTTEYSRPVRRCETNYRSQKEERIDGYDVVYRYHGQKYATRMPYDPGKKLKIRVDVRPAA
jgi:uncharacterized protein YcfJ